MKKKIREKDMKADMKHMVVMRNFLRNPEKMWKFMRMLYLSNVIAHIQDSLLQELESFAPYMCDQSVTQRMSNASKSFSRLVDSMYDATKQVYHSSNIDDKFCQIVDIAIKITPIMDKIVNDCAWHGLSEFRWTELNRTMKQLVPQEAIDREMADFIEKLKFEYRQEYAAFAKLDKDEDKRVFSDAIEQVILSNHAKKDEQRRVC